jgi:hypothetical protein
MISHSLRVLGGRGFIDVWAVLTVLYEACIVFTMLVSVTMTAVVHMIDTRNEDS